MKPQRGQRWTIGLSCLLAASPCAFGQASWKLYDLRDLISALPPVPDEGGEAEPGKNVDDLLSRVCLAMSADCTRLVAGVYGIEAEENDHVRVHGLLEGLRDLHDERYAVELLLFRTCADQALAVGSETQVPTPAYRHAFVVSRRTPSRVAVLSQTAFVSGASPVVATDAVGYELEKTAVDEGLDVSVFVGGNGDDKDGTSIEVTGALRNVSWPKEAAELKTAEGAQIPMRFPLVSVRSVQSHLQIKYGKPVVLSVLAGFEEGQALVLAGSIRKL